MALTFAPCPTCGRNMHPLAEKLSEHARCFRSALERIASDTAAPYAELRSIMRCDYCGHGAYVQTEGPYKGRADLCPNCASGDTQNRDRERDELDAAIHRREDARFAVEQTCERCGAIFNDILERTWCPGCWTLKNYNMLCCEQARYTFRPGDPCGFRICPVHGNVNVERVD